MIRTQFKFINVSKITGYFLVKNNRTGAHLAQISWHQPWKQYVVEFNSNAIFSSDCIQEGCLTVVENRNKGKC